MCIRDREVDEPIDRIMIFKTNQGTDAHLKCQRKIEALRPYQSTVVAGIVGNVPRKVRGGHVIFAIRDETGSVDCAAYHATGSVRETALQLLPGDSATVSGGTRSQASGELTLNIEKLELTNLVDRVRLENPSCSSCGTRCESMGEDQGFRCRKCKARYPRTSRVQRLEPRKITLGVYIPPPRAHRHLTKPSSRDGINRPTSSEINNANIDEILGSLGSISIAT